MCKIPPCIVVPFDVGPSSGIGMPQRGLNSTGGMGGVGGVVGGSGGSFTQQALDTTNEFGRRSIYLPFFANKGTPGNLTLGPFKARDGSVRSMDLV